MGRTEPQLPVRSGEQHRYGTAYLAILPNNYLGGIQNRPRRYAVITALQQRRRQRAAGVLQRQNARAVGIINGMQPGDVYSNADPKHPAAESRRYLVKVNTAQKSYRRK